MAFILGLRPAFSRHPPWHICSARNIDAIKNRNWQKRQLFHFSPFVFVSHSSRRGCFLRLHLRVDLDFFSSLDDVRCCRVGKSLENSELERKGETRMFFSTAHSSFPFNSMLWLSRKIKVSKVELNLNADRQKEIFQSVVKRDESTGGSRQIQGRVYHKSRNLLCGHESLKFY